MRLVFRALAEDLPGSKWQGFFDTAWPAYRAWYLGQGDAARPTYLACERALKEHMPELLPTYEQLVALAGGGDLEARFLSLYCPPPYFSGCSQLVWAGDEEPVLLRNYDYTVELCDAVVLRSRWNQRAVIAMTDCLWGVLDGMNEAGLAVSLAFGGRQVVGTGFGIPLVLRYILELCDRASDAAAVLRRVPVHMAYNVTVVDREGRHFTAYVSPDREAVIRHWPLATNHQQSVEWPAHAEATGTIERERFLASMLSDPYQRLDTLHEWFLRSPLYSRPVERGWGTLYTAVYRPARGLAEYHWPGKSWPQSFAEFREGDVLVAYE